MKIKVETTSSPMPKEFFVAFDEDHEDGALDTPSGPRGYGATEEEAIQDFKEQCDG